MESNENLRYTMIDNIRNLYSSLLEKIPEINLERLDNKTLLNISSARSIEEALGFVFPSLSLEGREVYIREIYSFNIEDLPDYITDKLKVGASPHKVLGDKESAQRMWGSFVKVVSSLSNRKGYSTSKRDKTVFGKLDKRRAGRFPSSH